ncbi:MAG: restriction endonuclease subunit S [Prevotella sp.]|nr:restriction endonuclease subunit S [Prevotella sp.]
MSEWKEVRLGDVCTDLSDGLHKAPLFVEGGDYIFVNAKNLCNGSIVDNDPTKKTTYEEYLKYSKPLNENTILFSIDGTIGNIARYKGEKCVLGKGACYINPNPVLADSSYIYFQLQSPHFNSYLNCMSTGSTIKHISLKTMRNYEFTLPPLSEQCRISSILSSLDDKIAVNRRICENLEAQAQALFKHWFIDFAPFKDGKFVESELGMIPEGWRVGTLGEICSYSKKKIAISQLTNKSYYSTENMLPNKAGAIEASSLPQVEMTTGCLPYDVLVSNIRPYFKKIVRVETTCGCSTDVLCFHPVDSKYISYMYRVLYNDSFFAYVMSGAKGTKMPRGDKQQIMKYPIVIPNDHVLEEYSNFVESMFELISSSKKEIQTLSTLRDTLLPRLMSGQIKV